MLQDELQAIRGLLTRGPAVHCCAVAQAEEQVMLAWEKCNFSDAPAHTLERYYSMQLAGITALCDEFPESRQTLLSLCDHLLGHYRSFLDLEQYAPLAMTARCLAGIGSSVNQINRSPDPAYNWLHRYLQEIPKERCKFKRLFYLQELQQAFCELETSGEDVTSLLVAFNFNHLGFFNHQVKSYGQYDTGRLKQARSEMIRQPERTAPGYDPSWVSLKKMLGNWLAEEIAIRGHTDDVPCVREKLYLDLSVAHLACFIRLCYEEGVMATTALTNVFRVMCSSFRTKRQPTISEKSFSKEFYSIDQHTAARVRDLLQRLLLRLNRKYFPFVIGLAIIQGIDLLPGMR